MGRGTPKFSWESNENLVLRTLRLRDDSLPLIQVPAKILQQCATVPPCHQGSPVTLHVPTASYLEIHLWPTVNHTASQAQEPGHLRRRGGEGGRGGGGRGEKRGRETGNVVGKKETRKETRKLSLLQGTCMYKVHYTFKNYPYQKLIGSRSEGLGEGAKACCS